MACLKHLWSIYEKMVVKGKEFDDIFDLLVVWVIVDLVKDCYVALGCIYGQWKLVVGCFKDYIVMFKFNFYQLLYIMVIGIDGKLVEVQIRTREMHQWVEWGVVAHWVYKEGSLFDDIVWFNRIVDWQVDCGCQVDARVFGVDFLIQQVIYFFYQLGVLCGGQCCGVGYVDGGWVVFEQRVLGVCGFVGYLYGWDVDVFDGRGVLEVGVGEQVDLFGQCE